MLLASGHGLAYRQPDPHVTQVGLMESEDLSMNSKNKDVSSTRPIDPAERPASTIKTRKITVEEAKASSRKAIGRYRSALKELAKR